LWFTLLGRFPICSRLLIGGAVPATDGGKAGVAGADEDGTSCAFCADTGAGSPLPTGCAAAIAVIANVTAQNERNGRGNE